jgi:hypothetical protein
MEPARHLNPVLAAVPGPMDSLVKVLSLSLAAPAGV